MSEFTSPVTFDELVRHQRWLLRLARRLVADEAGAEDLVQETWLAALKAPPRERGAIRGWLRRVLVRQAGHEYRRDAARREREHATGARTASPSTAAIVARAEVQQRVSRAVLELDEPYRETVLLRFFEDLPPREIARRMGVPVETVRTRVRRALVLVRGRLDREAGRSREWRAALLPWVSAQASTSLARAQETGTGG